MKSSHSTRTLFASLGCLLTVVGAAAGGACAHSVSGDDTFGDGSQTTTPEGGLMIGNDGPGTTIVVQPSTCSASSQCEDFSATPVIVGTAPSGAAAMFGAAGSGASGGPCLVEPQDGTLFPNGGVDGKGWLTPRVSFGAAAGQDLFEIRFHTPVEKNDLVVYTSNTFWTLDLTTWLNISKNLVGQPITVTVRASAGSTITLGGSAAFTVASLEASGSVIYWTTAGHDNNATSTALNGFHIGDIGNAPILASTQVTQTVVGTQPDGGTPGTPVADFCIGCHTATPDGLYVAFTAQWPWANALASVTPATAGATPTWLGAGGLANLSPVAGRVGVPGSMWYAPPEINQMMLGIQTFSAGHYATGDRIVVTQLGAAENATALTAPTTATGVVSQLAWINLEFAGPAPIDAGGLPLAPCGATPPGACLAPGAQNAGWGTLARAGDTGSAGAPSWSHNLDGKTDVIAYTQTVAGTKDGRVNDGPADIYTVPYTTKGPGLGGAGGMATPLPGASDPAFNEYYPAWSPDDALIAFNRVAMGQLMYNQPLAEVFVVPSSGGTATRLAANDPAMCTGQVSPGVQNTWPKWAPLGGNAIGANKGSDGKLYYWVTFSSTRITGCTVAGGNLCSAADSATASGTSTGNGPVAQLFVAGVVVDPSMNNAITTYPAIYLANQDFTVNNLIPAWENFALPQGIGSIPPK